MITVAVAQFKVHGMTGENQWLGISFADAALTELSRSRQVRIVERELLEDILEELELQSSVLIDESSAARIGRLLGARAFIFGSVSQFGNDLVVRARIVNVERGEVVSVAEAAGKIDRIPEIQRKLARSITGKMAIEAALLDITSFEVIPVRVEIFHRLRQFDQMASSLPIIGTDSNRQRSFEYQNALNQVSQIVSEAGDFADARYYRSLFALQTDQIPMAEQDIAIARRLHPEKPDFILLDANISYVSNDFERAAGILDDYTRSLPGDARGWYALGRVQMRKGDHHGAVLSLLNALDNSPYIYEAETNLRTLISGPAGLFLIRGLKKMHPASYHTGLVLRAFWNESDVDGNDLHMALASFPGIHILHYMKGINLLPGSASEARVSFEHSLNLHPGFPEGHRGMGLSLLEANHCHAGREHIRLYLGLARHIPDFGNLQNKMSRCR